MSNGGALAYLGGDRSVRRGAIADEPVRRRAAGLDRRAGRACSRFSPRLTPEGQRHPITVLGTGGMSNEAAWAALPAIPGMNLTRLRPGAVALLDHPFTTVDGKNAPLLAIQEVGRGRALALATDGLVVLEPPRPRPGLADPQLRALLEQRHSLAGARPRPHHPVGDRRPARRRAGSAGRRRWWCARSPTTSLPPRPPW